MTSEKFLKVFIAGLLYARFAHARSTFGIGEITEYYGWVVPDDWKDILLEGLGAISELSIEQNGDFLKTLIHISAFPEDVTFGDWSFDDFLEIHQKDPFIFNEGVYRQRKRWRLELVDSAGRSQPVSADSSSWTGLPSDALLSEERRSKLIGLLGRVESDLDALVLSNEEKAQVRSYVVAARILADAPTPPADLIWEIINRANQISGVASLFVAIIALLVG